MERGEPGSILTGQATSTIHAVSVGVLMYSPPQQEFFPVLRADAENEIRKHIESVRGFDFLTPLILLASIGMTFATSNFHKLLNQSPDFWRALYAFAGLWCIGRLGFLGVKWLNKDTRPKCVGQLVECILHISGERLER